MMHRRESISLFPLLFSFGFGTFTTLETRLGKVKGLQIRNQMVDRYTGIPYGKAPIGNLRFRKPEPYGSWNGTLDATRFPPSCMQFTYPFFRYLPTQNVSEDCLFLNIYVPRKMDGDKKSIMVWIHGGGFKFGQASAYDGSDLAYVGDVIVVTMNYRLGIFGFLSSGDSVSPGNYGIWDQRLALKWVKDNIEVYGGDSSSITIVGGTAGAMTASLLAMSSFNKNLFQRAIFQSGIALSKLTLAENNNLNYLGIKNNCSLSTPSDVIACLRQKPADDLVEAKIEMKDNSQRVILGPVVDGDLIPDLPRKLLRDPTSVYYEAIRSLDVIVGTTNSEGSVVVVNLNPYKLVYKYGMTSTDLCDVIAPSVAREFYRNNSTVSKELCAKYKAMNRPEQGRQIVNLYTDFLFVEPATVFLNSHSKGNLIKKTYQYSFEYNLPSAPMPSWLTGAIHGAASKFLFGLADWAELRDINVTTGDLRVSETMIKFWSNFAKTG